MLAFHAEKTLMLYQYQGLSTAGVAQRFAFAKQGAGTDVDGALAPQKKLKASVSTLPTVVDNQKMLAVGAADRTREQSAGTTPGPAAKRMGLCPAHYSPRRGSA